MVTALFLDGSHTGHHNPSFGRSPLEQAVFRSIFRAVEQMVHSWSWIEGGGVNAYALKELKLKSVRFAALTNALRTLGKVCDVVQVSVIRYWYDQKWEGPHIPNETFVAEYTLHIPFQVRWSVGEELVSVNIIPCWAC